MFSLLGIELLYAGRAELCQPAVGVGQVQIKSFLYLFAIMNVITIFGLMFILIINGASGSQERGRSTSGRHILFLRQSII